MLVVASLETCPAYYPAYMRAPTPYAESSLSVCESPSNSFLLRRARGAHTMRICVLQRFAFHMLFECTNTMRIAIYGSECLLRPGYGSYIMRICVRERHVLQNLP